MKVITWNVLASEWVKPEYYPDVPSKVLNPTRRNNRIILHLTQKIKINQPDIIALQEVMPALYARLQKFSNDYYISPLNPIGWGWGRERGKSGNVTLVRKSGKTIQDEPCFDFAQCLIIDKTLLIANVHLEDEHAELRSEQLTKLSELSAAFAQALILGDFNQKISIPEFTVHNQHKNTYFWQRKQNVDNILTKGIKSYTQQPWLFPESYYRPSQFSTEIQQLDWLGTDHYGLEWNYF